MSALKNRHLLKTSSLTAEELLASRGLRLEIIDKDLQGLKSIKSGVFVSNSIDPDLDPLIISAYMSRLKAAYQMWDMDQSIKHMVNVQATNDLKSLRLKLKPLKKTIQEKLASGLNLGFTLLSYLSLGNVLAWSGERLLLQVIKKLELPLIPVSINFHPDKPQVLQVRFGNPLLPSHYQSLKKISRLKRFLQVKIKVLHSSLEVLNFFEPAGQSNNNLGPADIFPAIDPILLLQDIERLSPENLLTSRGPYDVYTARAQDIPHLMQEIGRQREITFRAIGEGTGAAIDTDEYDLYYHQLFIWKRDSQEVVGGYRIGYGAEIFQHYGPRGLYISNLLKVHEGFYPYLERAAELGRSFVIQAYQKQPLPLFLLWKGILYFLLRHPDVRYLYGPVSISKYISNASKSVIVAFIKKHLYDDHLAQFLQPRVPFKPALDEMELQMILQNLPDDISALDEFIQEIEPTHIKVPVLIKQYARQNARFICFNLDPHFSDALDGFMILDLHNLPPETIEALKTEK